MVSARQQRPSSDGKGRLVIIGLKKRTMTAHQPSTYRLIREITNWQRCARREARRGEVIVIPPGSAMAPNNGVREP